MLTLLLLTAHARAQTLAGVTLPDTASVGGQAVTLNGLGLREKYFLDIYVGGLYLQHPTRTAATAIAADEPKRVVMHFTYRAVSKQQMLDTFTEGFGAAATGPQAANIAKMAEWVPSGGVKAGDELSFDYVPGSGTSMVLNGRVLGTVPGPEFMKLVFGIYLGPKPPTPELKAGMLGA
ncbi:hypothetical protein LBMAG42_10480 [Deltaproteobacteria bacterium]|nr:hypothetical protein LBMAG42_10480 [Deltaproteobacteria bacterium]